LSNADTFTSSPPIVRSPVAAPLPAAAVHVTAGVPLSVSPARRIFVKSNPYRIDSPELFTFGFDAATVRLAGITHLLKNRL
jgi:hypothetical protein